MLFVHSVVVYVCQVFLELMWRVWLTRAMRFVHSVVVYVCQVYLEIMWRVCPTMAMLFVDSVVGYVCQVYLRAKVACLADDGHAFRTLSCSLRMSGIL